MSLFVSKRVASPFDELGYTFSIPEIHIPYNKKNEEILDIVEGTGEILSDKKQWIPYKKMNIVLGQEVFSRALKFDPSCISDSGLSSLLTCSNYLLFKRYVEENILRLHRAYFCRNRLCPICNWRKSMKLFAQMQKTTDYLMAEFPTDRYLFLTLTVKNVTAAELSDTIDQMNNGFKYLVNKGLNNASAKKVKANLMGYAKAMEIKYDSEEFITEEMFKKAKTYYAKKGLKISSRNPNYDMYHPHFHVLLMVKGEFFAGRNYIKQAEWTGIWRDCMKLDYDPVVDIRVVKPNKERLENGAALDLTEVADKTNLKKMELQSAISETLKYPVKPDGLKLLEYENLNEKQKDNIARAVACLSKALFKRRLITFGGEILKARKKLELEDVEDGDLIMEDSEPTPQTDFEYVLYTWRMGCYIC